MKKKLLKIGLAAIMTVAMTMPVFADGDTVLTTTVPDAEYTLVIPEDQVIAFGTEQADIGNATISESSGFSVGKNVKVTVSYDAFKNPSLSTVIPIQLQIFYMGLDYSSSPVTTKRVYEDFASGSSLTFRGTSSGTVEEKAFVKYTNGDNIFVSGMVMKTESADWGKALGGDYTATITFTSEVVVAE